MKEKNPRGRKMKSDTVRVIPEFREEIDIEKLCHALIEIAKGITQKQEDNVTDKPTQCFY